jgi:hypothetical protein
LGVERQAEELEREAPVLPKGRFHVIVADPPWEYDSGNVPYPTMTGTAFFSTRRVLVLSFRRKRNGP